MLHDLISLVADGTASANMHDMLLALQATTTVAEGTERKTVLVELEVAITAITPMEVAITEAITAATAAMRQAMAATAAMAMVTTATVSYLTVHSKAFLEHYVATMNVTQSV